MEKLNAIIIATFISFIPSYFNISITLNIVLSTIIYIISYIYILKFMQGKY